MNEQELKSKASAVRNRWNEWLESNQGFPSPAFLTAICDLVDAIIGPESEEDAARLEGRGT